MKKLLFCFILITVNGCQLNPESRSIKDNVFWLDLMINLDDLSRAGYINNEQLFTYSKQQEGKVISYQYLPSDKLLYEKKVILYNVFKDSLQIDSWIVENDALSISDWQKVSENVMKKFVRSRENGLVFTLYLVDRNCIVYFTFPDVGDGERNKKRFFEVNGSVVLRDTLKDKAIEIISQPGLDW